jgi:hypothetical protein
MKGLANPYLRALSGGKMQYGGSAQMIAVACDSKGVGVFKSSTNTKGDDLWSSPFVLWQ